MAKHKTKKKMNFEVGALAATLLKANMMGYALTAIFVILAALLLTYTNLGPSFEKWVVLMGVMASAALVGFDTAKMENKNGYKWGMIGGLSYLVIYLVLTIILNGGEALQMGTLAMTSILALASGAVAGMFSVATQK